MKKVLLSIDGMTCSGCSSGLEKYLKNSKGVIDATVNLVMATAAITYEDFLSIRDLERYVEAAGFHSNGLANLEKSKKKAAKWPFVLFGVLAIFLLYVSMAPMLELPTFISGETHPVLYSLLLLLLTIPFLIYGLDILRSGLKNLWHKMPNMDTLVAIGVLGSFFYSVFGVIMIINGHTEYVHLLYFESSAFVIYFIKLGRYIDHQSREKTKAAIEKLVVITPKVARKKEEDKIVDISIDEVRKGDILLCLAGDQIAVDGCVVSGVTHVDESFITGESKPVKKQKQDKVLAGSTNYEGTIEYRAEKIGKETVISEVVRLMMEATNTKMATTLLVDKICAYFVPIVILLAVLTLGGNLIFQVSFATSLTRMITVLVVACPCALGLATPLAVVVSMGVCAQKGILVKSSEVFEIAPHIDTIVFDKTGTLTQGKLTVTALYNYSERTDEEVLSLLGSIEATSTHPIAKSILHYLEEQHITYTSHLKTTVLSGMGIKAEDKKKTYYAINRKGVEKLKIFNSHLMEEQQLAQTGNSIVYVVEDHTLIALLGIKDTIRLEAPNIVAQLKEKMNLIMLSGDHKKTAEIIGAQLGIDRIIAEVSPQEKIEVIKHLKSENKKVMMVGDGINDAPSLTVADIGVSMASGTDIASDAASVILMNNHLESLIMLLEISKKTLTNIKQNLFWAFFYNVIMIPIAMGILSPWGIVINPMIACIAMLISSLFVTANALRLRKL